MLALFLAALLQSPLAPPDSAEGTARAPSAAVGPEADAGRLRIRPRFSPMALYSPSRGVGIGGGVGVRNLGWRGSDLVVDVRVQQHARAAEATLLSADPYSSPVHVLISGGASTTSRRRYHGIGPATAAPGDLYLFHDAAQADLRVGGYPLGTTGLYVQPGLRLQADASDGVNAEASRATLDGLDPASQTAVRIAEADTRTALAPGLRVATDLRDWPAYPVRGLLASAEYRRVIGLGASDLTLDRVSASVLQYVPVRGRTAVVLRALATVTRSGDADGDGAPDPIPFYDLAALDDSQSVPFPQDRLTGRDVLAVGAGLRAPALDLLGVYGVDVLAMGYLGGAYHDVVDQFSPAVSFSKNPGLDADGRAALRPVLGVGIGLVDLDDHRVVVGALLGVGPSGVTVATLRVAYDLRDVRPLVR